MQKSFTLIELLVVIAVIGLIASVVLVSMGGLQSKAKITKILEFSQGIQTGLGAYAVGVWGFDEGPDGVLLVTAKDGSSYNNNGTCSGASCPRYVSDTPQAAIGRGAGKFALSFDGANDYVNVMDSNNLDITSAITIEAWVNLTDVADNRQIVAKNDTGSGANDPYAFAVNQTTGTAGGRIGNGIANNSVVGTKKVADGVWHHVVFSYNANYLYLYVDGVLDKTSAKTVTPLKNTANLHIGFWSTIWSPFKGLIDDIRIYERALTIGEIQKHYAEGLEKHRDLAIK